jgi:hypothetical protein
MKKVILILVSATTSFSAGVNVWPPVSAMQQPRIPSNTRKRAGSPIHSGDFRRGLEAYVYNPLLLTQEKELKELGIFKQSILTAVVKVIQLEQVRLKQNLTKEAQDEHCSKQEFSDEVSDHLRAKPQIPAIGRNEARSQLKLYAVVAQYWKILQPALPEAAALVRAAASDKILPPSLFEDIPTVDPQYYFDPDCWRQ